MQVGLVTFLLAISFWDAIADRTRLGRRTGVRATMANKLDPNFWPTRGRRSSGFETRPSLDDNYLLKSFQTARLKEMRARTNDPFWANRGRETDEKDPFWANRGRQVEEKPFWANRGRSNRQTSDEDDPFWANRGRSAETDISPWGKAQRDAEEIGYILLPRNRLELPMEMMRRQLG